MSRWPVPSSWEWASAGEIAEIVGGGTPPTGRSANFVAPGEGVAWLTPADLSDYGGASIARGRRDLSAEGYQACGAKVMPAGTVLFTSRAPIGYCVVADGEICTNQGFKSLVLRGQIDPRFIRQYLIHSKDYAESLASGSTFMELSGKRMKELQVPIPPLPEQRRIVAKIEALQARSRRAREALEAVPDLIEQFRQSVLAAAFRGDLTAAWREQQELAGRAIEPATTAVRRTHD